MNTSSGQLDGKINWSKVYLCYFLSTMSEQRASRLHRLQKLPEGLVVTSAYLGKEGYSRQLIAKYVAAGWLVKVGHNAYRRPGPPLKWEQAVYSLQALGLPFYAGGETAMSMLGRAHQLSLSARPTIHLYGVGKLPSWVQASNEGVEVRHHGKRIFDEPAPFWTGPDYSGNTWMTGWENYLYGPWEWSLRISSLERAWLEFLSDVPERAGFDEADELASGLRTLRPTLMDALLRRCRSIKVRRLALWLGERHHHGWVSKLDRSSLDLGHGNRSLVAGGRLIKRFAITVPRHLAENV